MKINNITAKTKIITSGGVDYKSTGGDTKPISRALRYYEKEVSSLTNEIPTAACGRPKRSWFWDWMNAQADAQ